MSEVADLAVSGATALVQYGALGIIAAAGLAATVFLVARVLKEADTCRERDLARQSEIKSLTAQLATLREKMTEQLDENQKRLQASIQDLAEIARALGRTRHASDEDTAVLYRSK